MSFTRLVEREAQINQSMLIGNIFPEEISEETTDLLAPPIAEKLESTQIPVNNIILLHTNNLNNVCNNRIWTCYTSATSTSTFSSVWSNIQATPTTSSTSNIILYTGGTTTSSIRYINSTSTGIYINENICRTTYKQEQKPVKKFVKNSIKRALKLLDNFNMEEDTKIFLKGDEIEVSHPESMFKFVITKRRYDNIIRATERPLRSVPFALELFTKNGIHVANLCVYAEDTPMLDNLFMVAMYVKSGNEEDLIRKANFFSVTKDLPLKELIVSEVEYLRPKLFKDREYLSA